MTPTDQGICESLLRVHGVQSTTLAELIGAQLATAKVQQIRERDKEIGLRRIQLADKERHTLQR